MNVRLPAIATALLFPILVSRTYHSAKRNWQATAAERTMSLPGDDVLPRSGPPTTMAIAIDAPPSAVWPWLVQMGVDRAGLYTHLWVENGLFRLGVVNADRIVPEWQDLKVGDTIAFVRSRPDRPGFGPLVLRLDQERELTVCMGETPATSLMTWQFVLHPLPGDRSRLLLRTRSNCNRPLGVKVFDFLFEAGYTYMDIGMLRGIRDRAEQAHAGTAPDAALGKEAPHLLVAYAGMQGSTAEIAGAMAATLRTQGYDAIARDVDTVEDVASFDAVILGSAIHTHHWMRKATHFVRRFQAGLNDRPVWLFSVGMLGRDRGGWPKVYPVDLPDLMEDTGARGHQVFFGRRQMGRPVWLTKVLMTGLRLTIGDLRDWTLIDQWTRDVGDELWNVLADGKTEEEDVLGHLHVPWPRTHRSGQPYGPGTRSCRC